MDLMEFTELNLTKMDLMEFTDSELSTFQLEQLNLFKNELMTQFTELNLKRIHFKKEFLHYQNKCQQINKYIESISSEIKRRGITESVEEIINENIKNYEGFELLNKDEILIIITKMDKTDYTKYRCPRYKDLDEIIKEVIKMKQRYPNWKLANMVISGKYESMPPQNVYKYEYKDEYDNCFQI